MISVLTATYNAQATLATLMASLAAQTRRDFEWVVVDGGSTDGTLALLRGTTLSVRWISEPDGGIYDALNKALRLARGEYYLVVGADDELEPRAIEVLAAAATSGADLVAGAVRVGATIVPARRRWPALRSGPPRVAAHSVGTLIRRALHDEIGDYSRRYPIAADSHFLLQAWRRGKRFAYVPQVLGRFGRDGLSSGDTLGALCESFRARVEVCGGLLPQSVLLLARLARNAGRIEAQRRRRQGER